MLYPDIQDLFRRSVAAFGRRVEQRRAAAHILYRFQHGCYIASEIELPNSCLTVDVPGAGGAAVFTGGGVYTLHYFNRTCAICPLRSSLMGMPLILAKATASCYVNIIGREGNALQLNLDILAYRLFAHGRVQFFRCNGSWQFSDDIRLYDPAGATEHSGQLYVTDVATLRRFDGSLSSDNVYLCLAGPSDTETLEGLSAPVVALFSGISLSHALNCILDICRELRDWERDIHIATLEQRDIAALVDRSEILLGCPLVVLDPSFNLLAASPLAYKDPAAVHDVLEKGYTLPEVMLEIKRQGVVSSVAKRDDFVFSYRKCSPAQMNVHMKFTAHGTVAAYGVLFRCPREAHPGYLKVLRLVTDAIQRYFENANILSGLGLNQYGSFLSDLMNSRTLNRAAVESRLSYFEGLTFDGPYLLAELRIGQSDSVPIAYFVHSISGNFVSVLPFVCRDAFYLLRRVEADGYRTAFFEPAELSLLDEIFDGYSYRLGVSNRFETIDGIRDASTQCAKALEFGTLLAPRQHEYDYGAYYAPHLFQMAESVCPLRTMQSPAYLALRRYDEAHRTDFCRVYVQYLICGRNTAKAAEPLFLHRNTLAYHIKKIEALLGIAEPSADADRWFVVSHSMQRYLDTVNAPAASDE